MDVEVMFPSCYFPVWFQFWYRKGVVLHVQKKKKTRSTGDFWHVCGYFMQLSLFCDNWSEGLWEMAEVCSISSPSEVDFSWLEADHLAVPHTPSPCYCQPSSACSLPWWMLPRSLLSVCRRCWLLHVSGQQYFLSLGGSDIYIYLCIYDPHSQKSFSSCVSSIGSFCFQAISWAAGGEQPSVCFFPATTLDWEKKWVRFGRKMD